MHRRPTLPWFVECILEQEAAKRIPGRIVFGRQAFTANVVTENLIVVDVQRGADREAFRPPNPNKGPTLTPDGKVTAIYHRAIACEALISAVCTTHSARRIDHVELLDNMVNDFVIACWGAARDNGTAIEIASGGSPRPVGETEDDLQAGYDEVGARYLLRFFLLAPVSTPPVRVGRIDGARTTLRTTFGNTSTDGSVIVPTPDT